MTGWELLANAIVKQAAQDYREALAAAFGPDRADVIYDCAGNDITMGQAIANARKGSGIVLVAVFAKMATVDLAVLNDHELDLNSSMMYRHEHYVKAIELVNKGAKLIGCNPDHIGVTERGVMPATGSLIAPIEIATGKKAYFVGKPNPLIVRHALNKIGCHSSEIAFVGDRMDTDIIAGIESSLDTVLVLSGVTTRETINDFPYRPKYILNGICDLVKDL